MSMLDRFNEEVLKQIRHYSQEEGLHDHEIAEKLGCSRATVNRKRQLHEIPMANLSNRQDKKCMCEYCGYAYTIRRKERRQKGCPPSNVDRCTKKKDIQLQKE